MLVSAACVSQLDRKRSRQRTALNVSQESVQAAINVGKEAARSLELQRYSRSAKSSIRRQEVGKKVEALKGKKKERYRKMYNQMRGQAKTVAKVDDQGEDEGEEEAEFEELNVAWSSGRSSGSEPENRARPEWSFSRPEVISSAKKQNMLPVSEEARAVMETELNGEGGIASSRQLVNAADEYRCRAQWSIAAELYELCLDAINKEQLSRKIDLAEAIQRDEEVQIKLGVCFESGGRLTLAFNHYDRLRTKLQQGGDQAKCEAAWALVGFKLAKKLQEDRRWRRSLDVLKMVRERYQVHCAYNWEELEIYIAMGLQGLNRTAEATNVLLDVRSRTGNSERRAQCDFIMDVMNVDTTGQRNEEFHKIWDENFVLPKDGISQIRVRKVTAFQNMSPSEREFKQWASGYWEERLKSPLYYAFLTLWVTWPFAIPALAIMRRSGLIE